MLSCISTVIPLFRCLYNQLRPSIKSSLEALRQAGQSTLEDTPASSAKGWATSGSQLWNCLLFCSWFVCLCTCVTSACVEVRGQLCGVRSSLPLICGSGDGPQVTRLEWQVPLPAKLPQLPSPNLLTWKHLTFQRPPVILELSIEA